VAGAAAVTRPRVVFVADDLGLSAGIDDGIALAARGGNVREASLCVTVEGAEHGVATARAHGLGIGLHLSLTLGRALTGPLRGLTDADGRFRSLRRVLLACTFGAVDRDAIAREVDAQLQRVSDLGVVPTHLNGHHHVHVFPGVRDVAFAVAAQRGVRWTRLPEELPLQRPLPAAAWLLARMARKARPAAERAALRSLPFVGIATEGRTDFGDRSRRIASRLTAGGVAACEWMVHPRRPDPALEELDPAGYRRPAADELVTLSDPELAARWGVEPVAFAAL